jgi:hypothetical protein
MSYARGKYAYGFCDRTGFRYPLKGVKINDPQSLLNPRPDTSQNASRELFGWNPVGNPAQYMVGSVGRVTVTTTEGS